MAKVKSKKVRGILRKWERIRYLTARREKIAKEIEKLENTARLAELRLKGAESYELAQLLKEAIGNEPVSG